jgi:hypothetical protein
MSELREMEDGDGAGDVVSTVFISSRAHSPAIIVLHTNKKKPGHRIRATG